MGRTLPSVGSPRSAGLGGLRTFASPVLNGQLAGKAASAELKRKLRGSAPRGPICNHWTVRPTLPKVLAKGS